MRFIKSELAINIFNPQLNDILKITLNRILFILFYQQNFHSYNYEINKKWVMIFEIILDLL